jgi:AcrR family transcriptional regulator
MQDALKTPYHHGNLKAALIAAADEIIAEKGIEGFSLREAARRAGVSAGAPAHHFGTAVGLLTEVALLGYGALGAALNGVPKTGNAADDLRALAAAYVGFALAHGGRFRLMFRADLVNRSDPRYASASAAALTGLAEVVARLDAVQGAQSDQMARVFVIWGAIHGMANLVLDEKAQYLFGGLSGRTFTAQLLPQVLAAHWP